MFSAPHRILAVVPVLALLALSACTAGRRCTSGRSPRSSRRRPPRLPRPRPRRPRRRSPCPGASTGTCPKFRPSPRRHPRTRSSCRRLVRRPSGSVCRPPQGRLHHHRRRRAGPSARRARLHPAGAHPGHDVPELTGRQMKSATSGGRASPPSSMVMKATLWSVGRRCQNWAAPVAGSGTGCGGGASGKVGTWDTYQSRLPGTGFASSGTARSRARQARRTGRLVRGDPSDVQRRSCPPRLPRPRPRRPRP